MRRLLALAFVLPALSCSGQAATTEPAPTSTVSSHTTWKPHCSFTNYDAEDKLTVYGLDEDMSVEIELRSENGEKIYVRKTTDGMGRFEMRLQRDQKVVTVKVDGTVCEQEW